MSLVKKTRIFFHFSTRQKFLFFRALFLSGLVRFTLSFLPFRKVMKWLGTDSIETDKLPDPETLQYRTEVKTALALADRYTFWKTECYTRSLTAKILLRKKGIPSTLYIGFYKDETGVYKGHAWLRSADMLVTGNMPELHLYQVHSFFS
ncbi:lasso peptide biosynthesis B2 protein [Sediminibacterium ginsengisoli]|uniref:Transglutaminase-like superfamily protein n=1 Tax=Sediminibacterium ginsengisoli TaxID=413434 RepID=A0A1T4L6R8_9BACT|nr:lasso peptide biosynthesis B2 protein [Sediminibacterium ginsengisoli]SJZ50287.1 Transglutaminase-like superfamily protein [Sediminibacterium ginsengisoli]